MVVSLIPGATLSLRIINITLQDSTVFTLQTVRVQDLCQHHSQGQQRKKRTLEMRMDLYIFVIIIIIIIIK